MASTRRTAMLGKPISPVVAIHGDYDPYPAEGVEAPLAAALADFEFILLERCDHTPWLERRAQAHFDEALEREL